MKPQLLRLLLLMVAASPVLAQTGSIKGKVSEEGTGKALSGATVAITKKGTGGGPDKVIAGAISRSSGVYEINDIPAGEYQLRTSYVGFKPFQAEVKVVAGQITPMEIILNPDVVKLEEVVVVGAASRTQKSKAEVAVSRVDAVELQKGFTYTDVNQLLAGKIPGVSIAPSSGNIGGSTRFRVRSGGGLRGTGSPVIYLDGARVIDADLGFFTAGGQASSSLFDISPESITSVEVLKGPASAALYGTGGSNGVMLFSTRGGVGASGEPITIQYRGSVGYNEPQSEYTRDELLTYKDANSILHKGYFNQHSVTLAGSTSQFNYDVNVSSRVDNGIINNNHAERQGVKTSFEVQPVANMTLRLTGRYAGVELNRPANDNYLLGYLGNVLLFGPSIGQNGEEISNSFFFASKGAMDSIQNRTRNHRFIGSADIAYQPMDGLELRGVIGFDALDGSDDELFPPTSDYSSVGIVQGKRSLYNRSRTNMNVDASAGYSYLVTDGLAATSIVGMQLFRSTARNFFITKEGLSSNLITAVDAATEFKDGAETRGEGREAGLFFQQEFSLDNIYSLSFGVRNDFASSYGTDAPSIFYPRASAAVRLDKLDLLPSAFNFAKFRLGYGQSGQLPSGNDGVLRRWGKIESGFGIGADIAAIGNTKIEPERVQEFEVGVEFEINEAYGLDFTYFVQSATSSIIGFQSAPSTGQTANAIPTNVGAIDGWGFEAQAYATILRTADVGIEANLNWTFADNEVKDLGGASPLFGNANVIQVGLPRGAFYLPTILGAAFDSAGVLVGTRYKLDSNGLPLLEYQGRPDPTHSGSFSLTCDFLSYFRIYGLAEWGLGNSVFNQTNQFAYTQLVPFAGPNSLERRRLEVQLGQVPADAYGDIGVTPLTPNTPEYVAAAERFVRTGTLDDDRANWLEEADYFRIREISVAFDASSFVADVSDNNIKQASLAFSVRNVALFTKYSGKEVELNNSGTGGIEQATDFLTLQSPRTLTMSLTLGF